MDDKSKQQGQGSQQNQKDARPGMADRGQDERNREEAGKPVQLDEKGQEKKPGMPQSGGQHGQHGQQQGGQSGGSQQGGQKH
jgi:hypothetical protein